MLKNSRLFGAMTVITLFAQFPTRAEESKWEKAETTKNKSVDGVKRVYRDLDDKGCETINGKLSCVSKKIKNEMKNSSDKVKTKAKEIKNQVD